MGHRQIVLSTLVIFILLLTACTPEQPAEPEVVATDPPTEPPPKETEAPVATEAPTEPPAEPAMEPSGMPADAQRVEFQAEDGHNLVGYYYPSKYANAPVIVLMHWAGGDQTDWPMVGLVQWLQNRPDENPIPPDQAAKYKSMPEKLSFAVFTFDFRDFGESDPMGNFDPLGWLMDAKAAYETASKLAGVDPLRMAGIGSSIGADGVIDACLEGCLGVLSLSPGNYLKIIYADAVTTVDNENKPAWCIATEGDSESAPTCRSASGDNYFMIIYPGNKHGTQLLVEPDVPEDIGQVLLDWVLLIFNG